MKYVLFVCTHNAGRSQMAQALFERYAPDDVRGESAGSDPRRQVWPEVIEVMRELDIDLFQNKPKRLTVEMQLHADWAVTMGCGDVCPYVPTTVDALGHPRPRRAAARSGTGDPGHHRRARQGARDREQTRSGRTGPRTGGDSRSCSRS